MQPEPKIAVASKGAIYAKSAVADQGAIDARVKICKKYVAQENMEIDPIHVYADNGLSGSTLDQRPALTAMLAAASTQPRSFDVVLVDTTAHLARSIVLMQSIVEQLTKAGVAVIFVLERLDSRKPNFRQLIAMSTLMDDQYISFLREKVRRGQKDRVLSALAPAGHCYGFCNVSVERYNRNGGTRTIGKKREIVPAEAEVIQQIFALYNNGLTLKDIAHRLNDSGARDLLLAGVLWSPFGTPPVSSVSCATPSTGARSPGVGLGRFATRLPARSKG